MTRRRAVVGALVLVGLVTPLACSDRPPDAAPDRDAPEAGAAPPAAFDPGDPDVPPRVTRVGTVDGIPTGLVVGPDGTELLVSTHEGRVTRIGLRRSKGHLVPSPDLEVALDLSAGTRADARAGGLLNIGLDRSGGRLLALHTTPGGTVALDSFPYAPGARIDSADATTVMAVDHPYVHSGGGLATTPDGDLVVGVGAFEVPGEPPGPQQPDGVVLRVPQRYLDGSSGPFVPSATDLVARGLRNPWRIAVDEAEGHLWIGDVGEDHSEELDLVALADPASAVPNFGWPYLEGADPYVEPLPDLPLAAPHHVYGHEDGGCAVSGGLVVRGGPVRSLDGAYLFGDYCRPEVRALPGDGSPGEPRSVADIGEQVVGFAAGPAGETYVLGGSGGIFRLDPPGWVVDDVEPTASAPPSPAPLLDLGDAGCRFAAAITATRGSPDLSPPEFQAAVERLTEITRTEAPALPAWLRADGDYLVAAYQHIADVAATAGWDPQAEPLRSAIRELGVERGSHPSALRAQFAFLDNAAGCP